LSYKWFPIDHVKRTKISPFIVFVTLWWIIFMNFIVPRLDFTMGQLLTAILWAFIMPAGAVIGCSWGMEAATQKQNVR